MTLGSDCLALSLAFNHYICCFLKSGELVHISTLLYDIKQGLSLQSVKWKDGHFFIVEVERE